jgi:hypothetical protein
MLQYVPQSENKSVPSCSVARPWVVGDVTTNNDKKVINLSNHDLKNEEVNILKKSFIH